MATDVSMVDTDTARGRLRLPLMLSPAMDTTAVDMVATDTDVSMVDMADTMARGLLRLMLSPAMDTDVSMVDMADTTDKSKFNGINLHSFTATFILVLKLSLVLPQNFLK